MSHSLISEQRPLPFAPRPFDAEVLGGWIGRIAARYRMTVQAFAATCELDFKIPQGQGWLLMSQPQQRTVDRLAMLTRISRERIKSIHEPPHWEGPRTHFCYCAVCVRKSPGRCSADLAARMARAEPVSLPDARGRISDTASRSGARVQEPRQPACLGEPPGTSATLWDLAQAR
jgi:hypothetical protein